MEEYRIQLDEIEIQLKDHPDNVELLELRKDLELLISLEQQNKEPEVISNNKRKIDNNSEQDEPESQKQKETIKISINDLVYARNSSGKMMEARVESVDGNYIVAYFPTSGQSERIELSQVKPVAIKEKKDDSVGQIKKKPKQSTYANDNQPVKKKKQTLQEHLEKKEKEHSEKQNAWKSFASNNKLKKYPMKRK